jgi:hypothetical protein
MKKIIESIKTGRQVAHCFRPQHLLSNLTIRSENVVYIIMLNDMLTQTTSSSTKKYNNVTENYPAAKHGGLGARTHGTD